MHESNIKVTAYFEDGYNRGMMFLWRATRGYRMMPWRSPYLRWRLETYTGKPADTVTAGDFARLAAKEWRQMLRFLRWTSAMQGYAGPRKR